MDPEIKKITGSWFRRSRKSRVETDPRLLLDGGPCGDGQPGRRERMSEYRNVK